MGGEGGGDDRLYCSNFSSNDENGSENSTKQQVHTNKGMRAQSVQSLYISTKIQQKSAYKEPKFFQGRLKRFL